MNKKQKRYILYVIVALLWILGTISLYYTVV